MGNAIFTEDGAAWVRTCSYTTPGRAMLLIGDAAAAAEGERAIAAAGGRLLRRIGWDEAPALLPQVVAASPVVLVEAADVALATLDAVLPAIRRFLDASGGSAVVTLTRERIDAVAACLIDAPATLLCDATPIERTTALAAAAQAFRPTLHDSVPESVQTEREPFRHAGRESDEERLRRLTEGMAQISRYAADLMRPGHGHGAELGAPTHDLADRRRPFHGEPGQGIGAPEVRRLIQLRQLRAKFFGQFSGEGLFEDPAWDMLLDLFAAELEGIRVSVSSLCIAAGVAPTTALRWITRMTELGLFIRHPDPVDRRRAFMTLSPRASEAMRSYMLAMRRVEAG